MKILFDQGTPVPLRRKLIGHDVSTAYEKGWDQLTNGELLQVAEEQFDLLITTDQNLQYQQKLTARNLAIIVLPTTSWPRIEKHVDGIVAVIKILRPGDYRQVELSD
jgi:hypothetical protein